MRTSKRYYWVVFTLILLTYPGYSQAGWLDKNLKKLDKAKELINSATKPNKSQPENKKANTKKKPVKSPNTIENKASSEKISSTNISPANNGASNTNQTNYPINQNEKDVLTQTQYYYLRDKYYAQLTEMKGKYKVFHSQSESVFHPLFIPVYKGVRRIGVMPLVEHYYKNIGMPAGKMDPLKQAFLERLWNDSQLYNNLKLLNIKSSQINATGLKKDQPRQSGFHYSAKTHMQSLAAGLFSPTTYARYFCTKNEKCPQKFYAKRGIFQWGGRPVDEFRKHKAYVDFVDNQVDKIKLWACQLDHSVYIVGTALLGEYDFDKKGYNLTLQAAGKSYNGYWLLTYMSRKNNKPFLDPNSQYNHLFISVNETVAEKLTSRHDKLYYAIKGKLTGYRQASGRHQPDPFYAGVNLTYDINGNTFEFFTDDLLTNKVFEKKIQLHK